jgi:AcrR family transcriptional regulator
MATAAPRWTRLEPDERRQQILAVARRLFSERHYSAVSTSEIAREAGVARGLLHHYFGGKRELFLEVVRSMLRMPPNLFSEQDLEGDRDEALAQAVDRWLEMVARNRGTWLATVAAGGFGHDPELEAIVEEGREQITDRLISLVGHGDSSGELRAVVNAYGDFAVRIGVEWVRNKRLTREQARELLIHGLLQLVDEVLPQIEAKRRRNGRRKG